MKSPLRSTAPAFGALAALCLAAPAANAVRPADHPPLPAQANEHATHLAPGDNGANSPHTGSPAGTDQGSPDGTQAMAPSDPCTGPAPARVFAQFHDRSNYIPVPNGGLEQGDAGWTLAAGASVVEGNDPFFLGAAADHQSLALPAGSSATTPATCFTTTSPTFRFVARTSGDRHARLKVEVLFTNRKGEQAARTAGTVRGGDAWRPSKRLSLALGRVKGQRRLVASTVAFRFTPVGSGDWQVDDVYLDPRARH